MSNILTDEVIQDYLAKIDPSAPGADDEKEADATSSASVPAPRAAKRKRRRRRN